MDIIKYPRTKHIVGSKSQQGDEDLEMVPFEELEDCFLTIEEKLDGANSGISFNSEGQLYLQSRGHFLTGGPRERQFDIFKQWAYTHKESLWELLKDRFIMYGEWLYAKHTIFYDNLPHFFMEFDILDKKENRWLSTRARWDLLDNHPYISSVPIMLDGYAIHKDFLPMLAREKSVFIGKNNIANLIRASEEGGLDAKKVIKETNVSGLVEGLYIKAERGGEVIGRYKWVNKDFLDTVQESGSHWFSRPILPNQLRSTANIFTEECSVERFHPCFKNK